MRIIFPLYEGNRHSLCEGDFPPDILCKGKGSKRHSLFVRVIIFSLCEGNILSLEGNRCSLSVRVMSRQIFSVSPPSCEANLSTFYASPPPLFPFLN